MRRGKEGLTYFKKGKSKNSSTSTSSSSERSSYSVPRRAMLLRFDFVFATHPTYMLSVPATPPHTHTHTYFPRR